MNLSQEQRARVESRLAAGLAALAEPARSTIPARATGDRAPASYPQQRLWFLDRMRPDSPAYLVPAVLRLVGPLDVAALRAALDALADRHEALRTTFDGSGGEPWQVVADRLPLGDGLASTVDLSELAPGARDSVWAAVLDEHRPMDLARGPLVRAALYRWGAAEHRLLLTLHHIVVDGWSLGLLLTDLAALYAARTGAGPEPPAPPLRYRDISLWQREQVSSGALDGELRYWTDRLAGLQPTELPTDRPRPAVLGWRGSRLSVTVDAATAASVRRTALDAGCTPFTVLTAAYLAVLHRYGGQREIVLGTPVTGRTVPEAEAVVGMLANTVVLRTDVSGDPPFHELLARVHDTLVDAHAHQDAPFELVVERLRPDRDPSRQPLFQLAFAQRDLPPPHRVTAGAVSLELMDMVGEAAKFDLSVLVSDVDGGGLRCEFEYSTDLFERATVERLAGHYRDCLRAALAAPATPLSALPLLSAAERTTLLRTWSAPGDPTMEPVPDLVPCLVAGQIASAPASPAVRDAAGTMSYGELGARSASVAAALVELGCGPEDLVAVCADRSAALVVAAYGVLLAGSAYLPLDPASPPDRLRRLATAARVKAVLVDDAAADRLAGLDVPVLPIPGPVGAGGTGAGLPAGGTQAGQLAYVVYTSGSTGEPKGVMVEHAGLANLVRWHLRTYGLTARDRCTLLAGPGFDASAWEMWTALAAGAVLEVPGDPVRADPVALGRWLDERGVTVTFLPTALAEAVLATPRAPGGALRYVLTGGDALSQAPAAATPALVNHYGPTENTVVATAGLVPGGEEGTRPGIGRGIDGVWTYVLDPVGEPVPVGVPGELWLGGVGVARGYLGDPERTAERFRPDPFGSVPGGRLYRTGDLVRWRADGQLDFLGRVDRQVQIRGHRVEPAEVEAVLREHPAVRDAVVAVRAGTGAGPGVRGESGGAAGDAAGGPGGFRGAGGSGHGGELVAAVVLDGGSEVFADELRALARRRLPAHMVPVAFVAVDRVPVNGSGKVDRGAVRWREARSLARRAAVDPPCGTTEEAVARVWRDVLGVDVVDRRDSFFEVGGHSFAALRVHAELERAFGVGLAVVDVFQHPTLAGLASCVDGLAGGADRSGTVRRQARQHAEQRRAGQARQQARRRANRSSPRPDDGSSADSRTAESTEESR